MGIRLFEVELWHSKLLLKTTQKLVMTATLQQAIKLLPLSRLELIQKVQQEILENPFLEEVATPETRYRSCECGSAPRNLTGLRRV